MARRSSEDPGFLKRGVPLRWVLVGLVALLIVMAAVVLAVYFADRHRDQARLAEAAAATSSSEVSSPYDFSELATDTDLDVVEDAAFISVLIMDDQGGLTSYGIKSYLPVAQALTQAVKDADELDSEMAASVVVAMPDFATVSTVPTSTITFVFPDRGTLTFVLDLDHGLIARGERAWQPAGDLKTLVDAAIAGNQ